MSIIHTMQVFFVISYRCNKLVPEPCCTAPKSLYTGNNGYQFNVVWHTDLLFENWNYFLSQADSRLFSQAFRTFYPQNGYQFTDISLMHSGTCLFIADIIAQYINLLQWSVRVKIFRICLNGIQIYSILSVLVLNFNEELSIYQENQQNFLGYSKLCQYVKIYQIPM